MPESRGLPVIGVVGGIGSGKSSVTRRLAEQRSVAMIDADRIGHELLSDGSVKTQLRATFGDDVFTTSGEVDRAVLAGRVFGSGAHHKAAKESLESIVHPRIGAEIRRRIAAAATVPGTQAVILDAAILLETGWGDVCDAVVFVDVSDEGRRRRVAENRDWSETELEVREASQLSLEEKKRRADYLIDNNQTLDAAAASFASILDRVVASH